MDRITFLLNQIRSWFDITLFRLAGNDVTLSGLVTFTILVVLLFYISGRMRRWIADTLLVRGHIEEGVRQSVATILRYVMVVAGLLIILQTMGIELTTLTVFAGTVGIGVGFGLQNIANNFVSGLIILFERPVKIGDRIEVGDVNGRVVDIASRSTTVVTNDNVAIIIPNSKFIVENVINWSYNDPKIRFKVPVTVAYGSDVRVVEKALLEVARANPDVLEDPAPSVRLVEFGDNGIQFALLVWSESRVHWKGRLISQLNFSIWDKFREYQIEIPFPQRDIHIRTNALSQNLP
jgi:small-conductance mechanosensitive channel